MHSLSKKLFQPDQIKTRMQCLPLEIQRHIYEYDPTFHEQFQKVVVDLRLTGARRIRLPKEWKRLRNDPDFHVMMVRPRNIHVRFQGVLYHLRIPVDYPFEPPRVEKGGKRLPPFEWWSPACSLSTVVRTCALDVDSGCEIPSGTIRML
jgi:hypothetical protein